MYFFSHFISPRDSKMRLFIWTLAFFAMSVSTKVSYFRNDIGLSLLSLKSLFYIPFNFQKMISSPGITINIYGKASGEVAVPSFSKSGSYKSGYSKGLTVGRSLGYKSGYAAGTTAVKRISSRKSGYKSGYSKGLTVGRSLGYKSGYAAGATAEKRISSRKVSSAYSRGYSNGKRYAYSRGYRNGKSAGYRSGYRNGKRVGYRSGYRAGKRNGYRRRYRCGVKRRRRTCRYYRYTNRYIRKVFKLVRLHFLVICHKITPV